MARLGDAALPDEAALLDQVSTAIAEGLVIGWFEGRMEWGPAPSATARSSATLAAPT